ncbi:MAG: HNH endonuclease [Acidobacteria bacterium]|nr:HNH endonuclease [Acidobacteriota bacterium]
MLRHGIAFSFETSQSMPTIEELELKVPFFNEFLRLYPDKYADMRMWHKHKKVWSDEYMPSSIPPGRVEKGVFLFLGKCVPIDQLDCRRILADFDRLLPLYRYVQSAGSWQPTFDSDDIALEARIPVEDVTRQRTGQSTITVDLKALENKKIDSTTKDALVHARVGQGAFREQVLQLWRNCCSVTGSMTLDAIRASHIKPWRLATDEERLDPNNGLPLVASLDALFDAGLISFEASGALVVSSLLAESEQQIFGLMPSRSLAETPGAETAQYLAYHRQVVFQK